MFRGIIFVGSFVALCVCSGKAYAEVMIPILDEHGKETGSFNVNPDPNGEPWIVTPIDITPEMQEKLDAIPEYKPDQKLSKTTASSLPRSVNHFKDPQFRPVFSQKGGSCSAASGTGYIYTWESNILTGASGKSNRDMYYYGFNFLNKGNTSSGIWWYDAWDIMKYTGCVSEADWTSTLGHETGTEWANTYEAYHNANFDRCSTYTRLRNPATPENIIKIKQWMYDHGRGDPKGGCVQLNAGTDFRAKTIPNGSAEAGSKIATVYDGPNTVHAMILAGYNDDVYLDPNKKGAFLLVNSWGTSFGTNGTMWIPYDKFTTETEVYFLNVVKHTPRLEYKITLKNYGKNGGSFTSGFSSSPSASSSVSTQGYGKAFSGNTGTFTGEIGLDCSDFWTDFSEKNGSGTFFLQSKGTGMITDLSLMIYDKTGTNLVKEIKCPQKNVSIGTTMSIVVKNTVAIAHPRITQVQTGVAIRKHISSKYELFIPLKDPSNVSIKDLQGRQQLSFATNGSNWYQIPSKFQPGIKIITVTSGNQQIIEKLNIMR